MKRTSETRVAEERLADYRRRADARLAQLFEVKVRGLRALPFAVDRYFGLMGEYALRGGKRVRGLLVELGYEAVAGAPGAAVLDASLSFELLHAFLLAYDDVMDRDELRRGGPSMHVLATREAAARGSTEASHRGLSVTMLLGLLVQSMSFECLDRAGASSAARRWFDRVTEGVTLGQLLDVVAVDAPEATTLEIAAIHRLKTGLYTTEGPLVLGALLAGAREDGPEVAALRGWATPVGEAFQLIDDVLGVAGDPAETGKPAGGDLREGKRTAVVEEALVRLPEQARAALRGLLGRPLDDDETERARGLVEASGAVEAVRLRARGLADAAQEALSKASLAPSASGTLSALARLVVDRQN